MIFLPSGQNKVIHRPKEIKKERKKVLLATVKKKAMALGSKGRELTFFLPNKCAGIPKCRGQRDLGLFFQKNCMSDTICFFLQDIFSFEKEKQKIWTQTTDNLKFKAYNIFIGPLSRVPYHFLQ